MTDYGHDLLFGTFVTPTAQAPQHAVDLAIVADDAGLDLVTFQDHPYHQGFLDTWTLLAYAAARTQNVRLSGNVLSLPLRPPAALARSAATLDRVSGGRIELGIGAGAFWDGIEAMGGRRLTPGQGVAAMREAVSIIRSVWRGEDAGDPEPGEYYDAARAGSALTPAHDIGVWIGAYKPRMLALTGEIGDGWLPTIEYLPRGVDSLPELNARIDDAAVAAGRDPAAVRRLLNVMGPRFSAGGPGLLDGPPHAWAERISELALDHGVSAVLIGGDDADATRRFAAEVVPAVRETVARERGQAAAPPLREAS